LLEWLTELREVLYSLLPVYYKAFDSGIAKGKKYIGQGILEMVWSFHNPSWHINVLKALQASSFFTVTQRPFCIPTHSEGVPIYPHPHLLFALFGSSSRRWWWFSR